MVVRYYGGVLLGTGGLVKAYGGGVGTALKQLEIRIKRQQTASLIQCDYTDMGAVEALIQAHQGQLLAVTMAPASPCRWRGKPLFGAESHRN